MNSAPGILDDRYADSRDDYRNGFIDAVTHCRGQSSPTPLQFHSAVLELHRFRAVQKAEGHGLPTGQPVAGLEADLALRSRSMKRAMGSPASSGYSRESWLEKPVNLDDSQIYIACAERVTLAYLDMRMPEGQFDTLTCAMSPTGAPTDEMGSQFNAIIALAKAFASREEGHFVWSSPADSIECPEVLFIANAVG